MAPGGSPGAPRPTPLAYHRSGRAAPCRARCFQGCWAPAAGPAAGTPDGRCDVPPDARAEDVSSPRTVVGDGTPASCTGAAFVDAVAKGGVITFACGPAPLTITLDRTAKILNDTGPRIV